MASKSAVYETGYDDELFQYPVGRSLHCCICTNVIKDVVMCPENEHLFCRVCISRHLLNSQTCPNCMQPLTVETLRQGPRGIRNLLSELKIRCQFFGRGCEVFIDLGDLDSHVADCGFAPAVCSNEGCELEVNKQDLLHHERDECELSKVKCHSCKEIKREIDALKVNLTAIREKLHEIESNGKAVENILANLEQTQEQLNKQEVSIGQLQVDNAEMKKDLSKITSLLKKLAQFYGFQDEETEQFQHFQSRWKT